MKSPEEYAKEECLGIKDRESEIALIKEIQLEAFKQGVKKTLHGLRSGKVIEAYHYNLCMKALDKTNKLTKEDMRDDND